MIRFAISLICLMSVLGEIRAQVPEFKFDTAQTVVEDVVFENPEWYDADVASAGDRLWYAWVEFSPGKGDRVWIGERQADHWLSQTLVTQQHGQYAHPNLTVDRRGNLWLTFEALEDQQWDVLAVSLSDGAPAQTPRRISPNVGADIHHAVAADSDGGILVVWQSDRGGQFDIVARHLTQDEISETVTIGDHVFGDWHPSIAADNEGAMHVVWDAYDGNAFNVHVRTFRGGRWLKTRDVARSERFQGRAHVVSDHQSRVWIVWEEGGENWGRPFRGNSTELPRDNAGPLHRFRILRLAVLNSEGIPEALADPLPLPSLRRAHLRPDRPRGLESTGAFYERARLSVDAAGRLWIVYRHYYTPWLGLAERSHVEDGWGVYARFYGAGSWSKLYRMRTGQGDGLQRLELTPHHEGIAAVWTTGRTHRQKNQRPRGVVTAMLHGEQPPAATVARTPFKPVGTSNDRMRPARGEPVQVAGKQYQVFYGDLHRHTDLSLCRVPIDGTIDDAYRYAIEVAALDFLGITDHSRDLAEGNVASQLWWRSLKEVYRHQLGAVGQRSFVPFYAYERSHENTADHNVISLRSDMLRPHTYPVPEFWTELDQDTITIPHQPIRRDTWKYQNDDLRPLVEVFQGCRDNAIEEDVHSGLAQGYHLGFIASSDHMSTSASYACVWAEQATRESIFRAMQARRTYAATAKIRLSVRAGEHWMGEIVRAKRLPSIVFDAAGTASIRSVNVIVDGHVHETISPNVQDVKLRLDLDLTGRHYVYFHLVQSDGNEAWSSPLWLDVPVGEELKGEN